MMRDRGDWHKWKTRSQGQRSAFRDSERRSLVLVPTEKSWHKWNGRWKHERPDPSARPHALTPDPSPGVPGEGTGLERELDLRAEHVAVHAGDEAGRGLAAG